MPIETLIGRAVREATPEALRATIDGAVRELGFDYFAYGRQQTSSSGAVELQPLIVSYPQEWQDRYLKKAYGSIDPVVQISSFTNVPFSWKAMGTAVPLSRTQQSFLSEAKDVGLRSGITVPIHHPSGRLDILSFARTTSELLPPEIPYHLQAMSSLLVLRWREMEGESGLVAPPSLTDRERECLTWAAAGKSSWDIGHILNVSPNTVNFHMKNAMRKLECSDRVLAVVKAIRLGVIRP